MKTQAIIPTAGIGSRFDDALHKPLVEICGKPVIGHVLEAFEKCPQIDSVIVVGHKEKISDLKNLAKSGNYKKVAHIVIGGETRRDSIAAGIEKIDEDADIIMVHDGVRPLIQRPLIESIIQQCERWDAVIAGVPIKPTVKKINEAEGVVETTIDREGLWEIQTPQAFKKDILIRAHRSYKGEAPTDDAMMVEKMGIKVKVVRGDYKNIKITTPEDLRMAESFMGAVQAA